MGSGRSGSKRTGFCGEAFEHPCDGSMLTGRFEHCLKSCFAWESWLHCSVTDISTRFESSNKNFAVNFKNYFLTLHYELLYIAIYDYIQLQLPPFNKRKLGIRNHFLD